MRKVIIGAMVSLDGVMQAPGGPYEDPTMGFNHGGWVAPLVDDVFGEELGKMFSEPFDLLLGFRNSTTPPSADQRRIRSPGMSLNSRYLPAAFHNGPSVNRKPVPSFSNSTDGPTTDANAG